MTKEKARKQLKEIRARIADKQSLDKKIGRYVLEAVADFTSVFVYVSMFGEVSTRDIIPELAANKAVFVPYTDLHFEMHAVRCELPLREPDAYGNTVRGEYFDGQAEAALVPLLGFDSEFRRLGYGKGCYDRYFAKYPSCVKIGLAYSEQYAEFDTDSRDVPLDMIITPDGIKRRTK